MEWASQLGLLLFLFASCFAGARLLWRGARRGDVPAWLIGFTLFVGGALGYVPLTAVAAGATPDAWTPVLRALGHLGLDLGALALYAFNRSVFRRDARWVVPTAGAALAATWLALIFSDGLDERALGGSAAYWLDFTVRGAAYVWATAETLHQYKSARRRLAIGLVEPAVANRFLLWGIAMGATSGMFVNAALRSLLAQGAPPPGSYLVDALLGTTAALAVWISFFAPRRSRVPTPPRAA